MRKKSTKYTVKPKKAGKVKEGKATYGPSILHGMVEPGVLPGFSIATQTTDHASMAYAVEKAFRRYGIEGEDVFLALAARCAQSARAREDAFKFFPYERGLKLIDMVAHDRHVESLLDTLCNGPGIVSDLPVWYQYFIGRRFREGSGKFFTPRAVARCMVSLIPLRPGIIIADPACGGGTFLSEASRALHGTACTLIGNDVDSMLVGLTEVVLTLNSNGAHATALYCDNLYDRGPFLNRYKGKVDCILANPPFSLNIEKLGLRSPLYEMGYHNSDAVFLDICLELLKEGGHVVCLLPHSIIANSEYSALRIQVERAWDLCGVITLPEGVFYLTANTTTRADILHLRKKGSRKAHFKKAYFANAPSVGLPLNSRDKNIVDNTLQDVVTDKRVQECVAETSLAP